MANGLATLICVMTQVRQLAGRRSPEESNQQQNQAQAEQQ